MAKNEPSKPDDVKAAPENAAPAEEQTVPATTPTEIAGDIPAPEISTEEAAALAHEGERLKAQIDICLSKKPVSMEAFF